MSGYQAYPEYRDSGVEWITEYPTEWKLKKVKYCACLNPSKIEVRTKPRDLDVTFLPMEAIGEDGTIDATASQQIGDVIDGYTYVGEGDVCIAKITPCFENGKGAVAVNLINKIAFATTEVIPIRPHKSTDTKFLYFLLSSAPFRLVAEGSMYGAGGQKRVADTFVGNYEFACPSSVEQQQNIANFLDHETAKIDTLIEKQQQLIKLLKEKRQAVISHAVTKGLNPDATMKDSGVEWLGEVPEHWGMKNLGHTGNCQNGINIGAEAFGKGYPFVSYGNVHKNETLPETVKGLVESTEVDRIKYSVLMGDVFFTRTSETVEEIGFAATCLHSIHNATFAGFLIRFRPTPGLFNPSYSKHLFRNQKLRQFFVGEMNLVTRASLSQDLLKKMTVLLPPLAEQEDIASYLDKICKKFDRLETRTNNLTNLLRERRTALISAAVTGKIDVRSWQPPKPTSTTSADA